LQERTLKDLWNQLITGKTG